MATKLKDLRIDEISGVDSPANDLPGWMVQKAKRVLKDFDQFEEDVVGLFDGLTGDSADLYFADAPDEVGAAREVLAKHLAEGLEDTQEEPETPTLKQRLKSWLSKGESAGDTGGEEVDAEGGSGDEVDETGSGDESGSGDEVDESGSGDETGSGDEDTGSGDEEPDVTGSGDEEPEAEVEEPNEELIKELAGVMSEQLEPLREAIVAISDRTGRLEKHAAGRRTIAGQEDPEVEEDEGSGMAKAITGALNGRKVELR